MERKGIEKEKEKKLYEEPEIEIIKLSEKDAVTASYGVKLNW